MGTTISNNCALLENIISNVCLFLLMLYVKVNDSSVMSGCFVSSWVEPVLNRG